MTVVVWNEVTDEASAQLQVAAYLASAEVSDLKYLGTLENVFVFNGIPGHEIVQVYDGVFLKNSGLYEQAQVEGIEADVAESFKAVWKSLNEFRDGKSILYPTDLLGLLR